MGVTGVVALDLGHLGDRRPDEAGLESVRLKR